MSDLIVANPSRAIETFRRQAAAEILDRGYTVVPFSISKQFIEETILPPFMLLNRSPEEDRVKWSPCPDYGLTRRGGEKPDEDRKFYFHERLEAPHELQLPRMLQRNGVGVSKHLGWFGSLGKVCVQGLSVIQQVACGLDDLCPEYAPAGESFARALERPKARQEHVIRLLEYDAKPAKKPLASGHVDYGFLTIAIYESHPGLWLGKVGNTYESKPGYAVVFPGRKMHGFTNGKIKALPHGVLSPVEAITRYAVVFFAHVDCKMGPAINENEAY